MQRFAHTTSNKYSVWIALFVSFVYLLSYTGTFHSNDAVASIASTESLLHGRMQVNRMEWEQERRPPQNTLGLDDNLHSKKGLGSALLLAPFLALGKAWDGIGAIQFVYLSSVLFTALTVLLFFFLARSLEYPIPIVGITTFILAFGTLLWPYSRLLFSETIAALGLCLAFWGIVQFLVRRRTVLWLVLCSVGLGILTLARSANGILVLPFACWVAYDLLLNLRDSRDWKRFWRVGFAFAIPIGLVVGVICAFNFVRFGTLFSFPQIPGEAFTTPLHIGVSGLLFSSGKGLLIYVPITTVSLISYWVAPREMRKPHYVIALVVIIMLTLFYGRWYDWPGGLAWGPRFLVPAMPVILLLCLPAIAWLWASYTRRIVLTVWIVVTVLAQVPGVFVNFVYQTGRDGFPYPDSLWQWQYTPLLHYWDDLFSGSSGPIWLHPFFWQNEDWLLGLLFGLCIGLFGWHVKAGRRLWRNVEDAPAWRELAGMGMVTTLFGVVLVMAAKGDVRWQEPSANFATNEQVRAYILNHAAESDVVLLDLRRESNDSARVGEWSNQMPRQPDYIGWKRKSTLGPEESQRLAKWLSSYGRVWLSLQGTDPGSPDSTTEGWLNQWAYRGTDQWIEAQRVVEYFVPSSNAPLVEDTANWVAQSPLELAFSMRQGVTNEYLLLDLTWLLAEPMPLSFSIQSLDAEWKLEHQLDQQVEERTYQIGVQRPAPDGRLLLKVYDPATGETVPILGADGSTSDFLLLIEPLNQ